ncbi:MAG: DUF6033 family protein [Lachnospiraceae bacterium]|nr:DUF6033 family protein [Lachnospiraceae bacterium]
MATSFYGVSAYQQSTEAYKSMNSKGSKVDQVKVSDLKDSSKTSATKADSSKIETKTWSPLSSTSSLIPKNTDDYGFTIGDVSLSDEAKSYYDKLKSKFGDSSFILVSNDMKSQVQQNAASYGNSDKMVILIDEAKLEQMATDESFRKKYEGIIEMSQIQMQAAKNSLSATGASVKNFGMSVDSDGKTSFFATLEQSSDFTAKLAEKRATAKKEAKIREKKAEAKERQEERLEKIREKNKADKEGKVEDEDSKTEEAEVKDYLQFEADSLESLFDKVSKYAYDSSSRSVMTDAEKAVGQHFDFMG